MKEESNISQDELKKRVKKIVILLIIVIPLIIGFCSRNPKGVSVRSEYYDVSNLEFIYDLSYMKDGKVVREHNILNEELKLINEANDYIIIDMFLFNDEYNRDKLDMPNVVEQVTNSLIKKKTELPDIQIYFITDPINNFYGAYEQKYITKLKDAKINVIITNLNKLKDSNPIYSGYYRTYIKWFGTSHLTYISNPFDKTSSKINIRSILKMANFKGNHRKVIITEKGAVIASANAQDASGYHSNIAFKFSSNVINDIIESEETVINFSKGNFEKPEYFDNGKPIENTKIALITEKEIYKSISENINKTKADDNILIRSILFM